MLTVNPFETLQDGAVLILRIGDRISFFYPKSGTTFSEHRIGDIEHIGLAREGIVLTLRMAYKEGEYRSFRFDRIDGGIFNETTATEQKRVDRIIELIAL